MISDQVRKLGTIQYNAKLVKTNKVSVQAGRKAALKMEFPTNSLLNDVNVPNHIDELDELLNSSWDHNAIDQCDMDALYAELNRSLLTPDSSPVEANKESDVVSMGKNNDTVPKNQVTSSAVLTPQSSPYMWNRAIEHLQTVQQPASNCSFTSVSQQMEANYNYIRMINAVQTPKVEIAQGYSNISGDINVNQVSEKQEQCCFDIVQQIKSEPIYHEQQPERARVMPAPSQVTYQTPREVFLAQTSFSPFTYIPYYTQQSAPNSKPPVTIKTDDDNVTEQTTIPIFTLATQSDQESPADTIEASIDTCCEPADTIEPAPGLTCAEYISSVQLASDSPETSETSPTYYIYVPESSPSSDQMPTFHILLQPHPSQPSAMIPVLTESASQEAVVQTIDPSADYVQIQNKYIIPSAGSSTTYPVEEIYRVDRPEASSSENSTPKMKPRKVNLTYGSKVFCHICDKEFGKQGSYQQHWRQKHEEDRPFRCNTCGKSYITERDLRQHQQNHEPGMKQWKCSECDNRYRHMKDRDRHYDTHHGTPAHSCMKEGCSKAFARRDHMMAHMISHDNRELRELKKALDKEEKENNRKQRGRKRKME